MPALAPSTSTTAFLRTAKPFSTYNACSSSTKKSNSRARKPVQQPNRGYALPQTAMSVLFPTAAALELRARFHARVSSRSVVGLGESTESRFHRSTNNRSRFPGEDDHDVSEWCRREAAASAHPSPGWDKTD